MNWLSQVTDIIDKYSAPNPTAVPRSVDDDFDRFSRHAPASDVSDGLAEAEKKDPSIIERISKYYADHPALIKTLGGLALAVAMARVAQRQTRGR